MDTIDVGAGVETKRRRPLWQRIKEEHPELEQWVKVDTADDRAFVLASLVAGYRAVHGQGPTWKALADQARPELRSDGYPDWAVRWYIDALVRALSRRGWLIYGVEQGSLRPGRRLADT
jgi:hypothetical protein